MPAKKKTKKPATTTKKPTQEDKVYAAVGYVWILCLVPLLLKKDSEFAQFHGKQGLVLFIIEVIGSVVFWIPLFGQLLAVLIMIVAIIGIIKALQGEYYKLPIIQDIVEKFSL